MAAKAFIVGRDALLERIDHGAAAGVLGTADGLLGHKAKPKDDFVLSFGLAFLGFGYSGYTIAPNPPFIDGGFSFWWSGAKPTLRTPPKAAAQAM